jgi:hypothetical protein
LIVRQPELWSPGEAHHHRAPAALRCSTGAKQEATMSEHAPKKPADLHTDPAESAPPNIGVIALVVIIVVMLLFLAIALWAGHLSH